MKNKFKAPALTPFTTKEIKPKGWLLRQLQIQADGLSGHLDEFWKDVKDSKWIGGPCESWERVPYWLDGFIPLAYLLDDEGLKAKAKRYIDGILERQCEDGWICPCDRPERPRYDTWAALLICKALTVYFDCTGDKRTLEATYKALKQLNDHLDHHFLFNWGSSRWFEGLIPLYRVAEEKGFEPWMEMLAVKLGVQGINFPKLFTKWAYKKPVNKWNQLSHVVNQAMMLKSEALYSRYAGGDSDKFAEKAYSLIMKHHGQAYGHFSGDECLSGTEPTQGTELCGVVEAMYSYEVLSSITGKAKWGDRLEAVALNALPATVSPDMCAHQYDQMANQVECVLQPKDNVVYRTNYPDSNIFGLEPNFGCCTANMHQGFPKLAASVFFANSRGFTAWLTYPAELTAEKDGMPVRITIKTDYPFRDTVTYEIENGGAEFDLDIRIPSVASVAEIDGNTVNPGEIATVRVEKGDKSKTFTLKMTFETKLEKRPGGTYCVRRGPLLYALKMEEKWTQFDYDHMPGDTGTERVYPFCDYTVTSESTWNYAFESYLEPEYSESEIGECPFSAEGAPCHITVNAREIPWVKEFGRCRPRPESLEPVSDTVRIELIPYGCTHLRMTELPMI